MTRRLAEDVVQDAFLGAWRNAARYVEGRGSVKTWLLSIVHHRAIDAVRRRRPTTELPESNRRRLPPSPCPTCGRRSSAGLDAATVRTPSATLSDVQREAIELAYFGGLTQQEIAERTATPLGTVKSRMRLGLLAMRRALEAGVAMSGPDGMRGLTCDEVREHGGRLRARRARPGRGGGRARAPGACSECARGDRGAWRRAAGAGRDRARSSSRRRA